MRFVVLCSPHVLICRIHNDVSLLSRIVPAVFAQLETWRVPTEHLRRGLDKRQRGKVKVAR
jgi:hypothetical protein